MSKIDEVVKFASKELPGLDWVIDMYDLSMMWVSPKATEMTGYSETEMLSMRNLDFMSPRYTQAELRQNMMDRVVRQRGEQNYVIVNKQGVELQISFAYYAFKYEGGEYMAGKIIEYGTVK